MWTCEVSYDLSKFFEGNSQLDYQIDELAKKYHGKSYASGAGCGYRDIAFDFSFVEHAEAFGRAAEELDETIIFRMWPHEKD